MHTIHCTSTRVSPLRLLRRLWSTHLPTCREETGDGNGPDAVPNLMVRRAIHMSHAHHALHRRTIRQRGERPHAKLAWFVGQGTSSAWRAGSLPRGRLEQMSCVPTVINHCGALLILPLTRHFSHGIEGVGYPTGQCLATSCPHPCLLRGLSRSWTFSGISTLETFQRPTFVRYLLVVALQGGDKWPRSRVLW